MRVVMVQLIGAISAVYQSTLDRIVVFVLGNDNHLYDKNGIGQDGYGELKEFLPVSAASGTQRCLPTNISGSSSLVTGSDGHFGDKYWNGTEWVWEPPRNALNTSGPAFRRYPCSTLGSSSRMVISLPRQTNSSVIQASM